MSQPLSTHSRTSSTPQTPPPIPDISHLDRVFYLFGDPIAHSLSPLFHGTMFSSLGLNYRQYLYECSSIRACLALTSDPKFHGASVTMPHKVSIIPFLDQLTPEGEAIGAINTIFGRTGDDGKRLLCGTNTDCIGVREAILRNTDAETARAFKGRPGMVIGGGGTCRAAVYTLKHFLGCSAVYLVNRDRSECEAVIAECTAKGFGADLRYVETVAEADRLEAPSVVVSAIPDFPPKTGDEVRARGIVDTLLSKEKGVLLEMCYHPSSDTGIARLSTERGWKVVPGVEAMIYQGVEQDRVWLNREVSTLPIEKVKEVIFHKLSGSRL